MNPMIPFVLVAPLLAQDLQSCEKDQICFVRGTNNASSLACSTTQNYGMIYEQIDSRNGTHIAYSMCSKNTDGYAWEMLPSTPSDTYTSPQSPISPMIPFACLVSFVAGWVAAIWTLPSVYNDGIRSGRLMAATYLECAAEEVPATSVDCVMSLAAELRAM